jgi:4-hydroxybenzoate adenylyltransferase
MVLLAGATRWPHRLAVQDATERVTLGELSARVEALCGWLRREGVRPGDRVVIALADGVPWVTAFLATVRVGAVAALLAESVEGKRAAHLIARAGPRLILTDRGELARSAVGSAEVAEAARAPIPDPRIASVRADDPCYLLATSGSTGLPKWVVHGHGDIPACIATFGRHVMHLAPGDVTWSVSPLATSYGLGNSLYFPLGAGAAACVGGARDPAAAAAACRDGGVTALYGVPTFWARAARHAREGRVARADFAGVTHAGSAGENLPAATWVAVARELGLRITNGLGSSEATNVYVSDRPGNPRAGTVGWAVPGYDLRLDGERPVPGREGELWVRGPTIMAGYLDAPEATARVREGPWLRTGDRVRLEDDRSWTFLGRMGDVFKVGGLWVDPSEVQEALLTEPDVEAAVVVAVPDANHVDRLVAVVASRAASGALEGRLATHLAQRLPRHMLPRAIVALRDLPMSPSGKVRRDAVVEIATDRVHRKVAT